MEWRGILNPGAHWRFPDFGGLQEVLDPIPTSQPGPEHVPGANPAHVAPLIPATPRWGRGGDNKAGPERGHGGGRAGLAQPREPPEFRHPDPKNPAGGTNSVFSGSVPKTGSGKLGSAVG